MNIVQTGSLLPVESNIQMWGGAEALAFRAVMWTKRLEILSYITNMINQFEDERIEYMKLDEECKD